MADKPITKELAVWAKEIGFDLEVRHYYDSDDEEVIDDVVVDNHNHHIISDEHLTVWSAPYYEELKHFIYEKYNIWIEVQRNFNPNDRFSYILSYQGDSKHYSQVFKTPIEALESALIHIKQNNLIQ